MAGDKLLSQIPDMVAPALTDYYYAINADGTVQGKVTAQQILNLAASGGNNLKTVAYTIGAPGVVGVDYNFTSVANTTEQSFQLGATTIIPANSKIVQIIAKCTEGLSGVVTGTADLGTISGGQEFASQLAIDDTDEIADTSSSGGISNLKTLTTSCSIYFSFTPSANWNTITTGKWKIWITYIDNSAI